MNLSKLKLFVVLLLSGVSSIGITECNGGNPSEKIDKPSTGKSDSGIIIDSLMTDLDKDGDKDKIEIIEFMQKKANRLLQIKMAVDKGYRLLTTNDSLITCASCGYQGGDDFTNLEKIPGGFVLNFWRSSIFFEYHSNSIYLKKIVVFYIKQTPKKLIEKKKEYTTEDFGVIPISEVGFHLKMLYNNH